VKLSAQHSHPLSERLLHLGAMVSILAMIGACGGGADGSQFTPPPPAPAPQPIPAQTSVPEPVGYDEYRLAAFNRINQIRLSAGLGMLEQNIELDRAAQAHANWQIANGIFSHLEDVGSNGFTGVNWWDRDAAAGYKVSQGTEVMVTGAAPASGVDVLVNMAYHRAGILQFEPLDVGIGFTPEGVDGFSELLVAEIAFPDDDTFRSAGQLPQAFVDGVVVWPLDGAANVAAGMGHEIPDPVPDTDVLTLGTPASVGISESKTIVVQRFEMFEDLTDAPVSVALMTHDTDTNHILAPYTAEIVPTELLHHNTKYRVEFVGNSISTLDSTKTELSITWRFSTGNEDYLSGGLS